MTKKLQKFVKATLKYAPAVAIGAGSADAITHGAAGAKPLGAAIAALGVKAASDAVKRLTHKKDNRKIPMKIKEAIQNIQDKKLESMKENFESALSQKAATRLEELKSVVAKTLLGTK